MGTDARHLSRLLDLAAQAQPERAAVEDEEGRVYSYSQLLHAADRVATRLHRWGVGRGDRVGLFLPKSLEGVAAIHGILRSGAAYVPVDPGSPPIRGAGILADAGVKAVVVAADRVAELVTAWPGSGPLPRLIVVGEPVTQTSPNDAPWSRVMADLAPTPLAPAYREDDVAYILYTSGSTGKPKGVMLSHANAFAFLDWCDQTIEFDAVDRFSSHAPFHFDLSIFDLYVCCLAAGSLVLIGEATGKDPVKLGALLRDREISVWYSAPSILALLTEYGGIDQPDFVAPRVVLFAGEVFPIGPLRRLRRIWPQASLWNLYGPTETNVCTAYAIPETIDEARETPFPIGFACAPLRTKVVDERGREVSAGTQGELVVSGPGVMLGYFGRPDLTERAFFVDETGPWYRTGDLVADEGNGCYRFHGRRDRMVKKRGYRIELGEIESALYRHEGVDRAGVIARQSDDGVSLVAFVAMKPGTKGSIIALKRHCTRYLPPYMIPDEIQFLSNLPTTSTDKVDYQGLNRLVALASH